MKIKLIKPLGAEIRNIDLSSVPTGSDYVEGKGLDFGRITVLKL